MRFAVVVLIGGLSSSPAWAATWYVEPGDTLADAVAMASSGDDILIDPAWIPDEPAVLIDKELRIASDTSGMQAMVPSLLVDGVMVGLDELVLMGSEGYVSSVPDVSSEMSDVCSHPWGLEASPGVCLVGGSVNGTELSASGLGSYAIRADQGGAVQLSGLQIAGSPTTPAVYLSQGASFEIHTGEISAAVMGAIWAVQSDVLLDDVGFWDNGASAYDYDGTALAGADLWMLDGTAQLSSCTSTMTASGFSDVRGGSIYFHGAEVVLESSDFYSHYAGSGGVIAGESGTLDVYDCTFEGSTAETDGGVASLSEVSLLVEDSQATLTSANAGGVFSLEGGEMVSRRNAWKEYAGWSRGGALSLTAGASLLSEGDQYRTTSTTGVAVIGGGVYADGSAIELRSFDDGSEYMASTMDGHMAIQRGGFLYLVGGSLSLQDVHAWNNTALQGGGFAWLEGTESAWVHDSVFEHHMAGEYDGLEGVGGVFGTRGMHDLAFKRCSFCNNGANEHGAVVLLDEWTGGAFEFYWNQVHYSYSYTGASITTGVLDAGGSTPGQAFIVNNTFTQDWAGTAAIGLDLEEVTLVNDIFAWQDEPEAAVWTADRTTVESSYGLYWEVDPLAMGSAADVIPGPGAVQANPLFVDFAYDDAPLCDQDWSLASGSPAIDAGDPGLLDEDGSRSDMGAYGGRGLATVDADGDGWPADEDCDDTRAQVYPGAPDAPDDGIDSDCDGHDPQTALRAGGGCATPPGHGLPAGLVLLLLAAVVGLRPREDTT